jgi:uncharacterized protein involved in exopolysaccharide biosynthesis
MRARPNTTDQNVNDPKTTYGPQDEIGFKEIVDLFWRMKWSALAIICTVTAIGASSLLFIPKKYTVKMILSPATTDPASSKMGAMGTMASQLGGLASIAGLGSVTNSTRSEAIATLQSEAVTERYIKENNLLPVLYKSRWDSQKREWKTSALSSAPTLWKGNQLFEKKIRLVSDDTKTGLVTFKVTWTDPSLAAQWANGLVKDTNDFLKNKAISESERNIAFLRKQAASTDVVEVRQSIYSLMQTEINKEMLAQGSDEYALKVIDPAVPPEKASSPDVVLWIVGSIFAGLAASITYVLARKTFGQAIRRS